MTLRRAMILVAVAAATLAWVAPVFMPMILLPTIVAAIFPRGGSWFAVETSAAVGWLAGAAVALSEISTVFDSILFLLTGPVLGVSWAARLVAMLGRNAAPRAYWGMLITPSVGLIGLVLASTDRDFDLRFRLSEPAFRAEAARQLRESVPFEPGGRRVGLFWVKRIEVDAGTVFFSMGDFFLDDGGLAYVPLPPPPTIRRHRYYPYRGPWWVYVRRF